MQAQHCRPGNSSELNASSKRKKTSTGGRIAVKPTSFPSRPLKLEDFIEERYNIASSLMAPEVQKAKDVPIHAMNSLCLVSNCSFGEVVDDIFVNYVMEPMEQSTWYPQTRRVVGGHPKGCQIHSTIL